jgi:hypothetical protein
MKHTPDRLENISEPPYAEDRTYGGVGGATAGQLPAAPIPIFPLGQFGYGPI